MKSWEWGPHGRFNALIKKRRRHRFSPRAHTKGRPYEDINKKWVLTKNPTTLAPWSHNFVLTASKTVQSKYLFSKPPRRWLLQQLVLAETEGRLMQIMCLSFDVYCITHSCFNVVYKRVGMIRLITRRTGMRIFRTWFEFWLCHLLVDLGQL